MTELKTPVIFMVFNRPELTREVFEQIRRFRPPKLLIVADGPRAHVATDADRCARTREILADKNIDWPCEVLREYADRNMGCKNRVASGLTWAFSKVDEAIVLEDDCLPNESFFQFTQELLQRYRHDTRVMAISGVRFDGSPPARDSYWFSKYVNIWGWASWSRAWKHYDVEMKLWPRFRKEGQLVNVTGSRRAAAYWTRIFDKTHAGQVDTWDHQWNFAILSQGGLCIQPNENLVTNVGFGPEATHTKKASRYANLANRELRFPLSHPPFVLADARGDRKIQKRKQSIMLRAMDKLGVKLGAGG